MKPAYGKLLYGEDTTILDGQPDYLKILFGSRVRTKVINKPPKPLIIDTKQHSTMLDALAIILECGRHLPTKHNDLINLSSTCTDLRHLITTLSEGQLRFFDEFMLGTNILLHGPAGCGKTYCIKALTKLSYSNEIIMTATTGAAAVLIDGQTLDSFIITLHINPAIRPRVIIIDEVSMLCQDKLLELDLVLRNNDKQSCTLPFAGVQIILVGDFLQLQPVRSSSIIFSEYLHPLKFKLIELSSIMRQKEPDFASLLGEIRLSSTLSPKHMDLMRTMIGPPISMPVRIVSTNDEASYYNDKELANLKGDAILYEIEKHSDNIHTSLEDKVMLKVGCRVMCLANILIEEGLINGTVGIITSFKQGLPVMQYRFKDTKVEKVISKYTQYSYKSEVVVADGNVNIVKSRVKIATQIPLRLAWASTVHKCQGQTLDCAIIMCNKMYNPGQFYTAISRVKSKQGVILFNYAGHETNTRIRDRLLECQHSFEPSSKVMYPSINDLKYDLSLKSVIKGAYIHNFDRSVLDEILDACRGGWIGDACFPTVVSLFTAFGLSSQVIVACYQDSVDDYVNLLWTKLSSDQKSSAYIYMKGVDKPSKGGEVLNILYVITDDDRQLASTYKIGYHTGTLKQLRRRYNTALINYKLEYYIESPIHVIVERRVHAKLEQYRRHGEWFACSLDLIKQVIVEESEVPYSCEQAFREAYAGTKRSRGIVSRILNESKLKYPDISNYKKRKILSEVLV